MASFTDTFERKEVKYRLNAKQHRDMLAALSGRMAADEYGRTRITSLYFDTPQRSLIARSLEKPLYKEKLRVRWYGEAQAGGRVYVEIKKKYDGIVYKRRVGCSREAAQAYLMSHVPYEMACARYPLADDQQQSESLQLRSIQIAREIDAFSARYRGLRPSMFIVCERMAYAPLPGGGADGLRITFDTGVSYRDAMALPGGDRQAFHPLLGLGEAIMEIKTAGAFPPWLVAALNGCTAFPSSFSKYGAAYEQCMRLEKVRAARAAANAAIPQPASCSPRPSWAAKPAGTNVTAGQTAALERLAPAADSRARRVCAPAAHAKRPMPLRKLSRQTPSRKEGRCA